MKIAVDAMGGDFAPQASVEGALLSLQTFPDIEIVLVGHEEQILQEIDPNPLPSRLQIVHTDVVISGDEEPVRAVRTKKEASLVQVNQMVKTKEADACISAGNTGAYMTAGLLVTGRIKGIERPALCSIVPTLTGVPTIILDVGANADAKPSHLVQYARMGSLYQEKILNKQDSSIGLLNIGTEAGKGNDLMRQTYPLLEQINLNFIGNVEAREISTGKVDVVVCDGFSGNVALKSIEGMAQTIFTLLKEELTNSFVHKLAALTLKKGFTRIKKKMDYAEYGGAPLLGLDGICIKAHGSSNSRAIYNAIRQARSLFKTNMPELIKAEVQKDGESND